MTETHDERITADQRHSRDDEGLRPPLRPNKKQRSAPTSRGGSFRQLSQSSSVDSDSNLSADLEGASVSDWKRISRVPSTSEDLDEPLSPSMLRSPDGLLRRPSFDKAVSSTVDRMTELQSFLSESSRPNSTTGIGEDRGINTSGSMISDDSCNREEAKLGDVIEEMQREIKSLDQRMVLDMPQAILAKGSTIMDNLSVHSQEFNDGLYEGTDELNKDIDDHVCNESDLNYSMESQLPLPFTPKRSANDDAMANISNDEIGSDDLSPTETSGSSFRPLPESFKENASETIKSPSSWIQRLGDILFDTHEYETRTLSLSLRKRKRTIEGGILFTASTFVALHTVLKRTELCMCLLNLHFLIGLAVLSLMITLVQIKVPHNVDEVFLSLGILVALVVLQL